MNALPLRSLGLAVVLVTGAVGAGGCGKDSAAATRATNDVVAPAEGQGEHGEHGGGQGGCGHAACADNFFIEALPAPPCAAGAVCTVTFKLVASNEFHINDEYPYRFRGDDGPNGGGVEFLGTDSGGKNVFSKAAGDWQKTEPKAGTMTLKFKSDAKGSKAVAGTFKLSVCSEQNCLLEQKHVAAPVAIN